MDGLFVVGPAGVLGAGVGLVEADVLVVERPLGEIDDGGMHAGPVEGPAAREGEGGHPALLGGAEPRPFVGPDEGLRGLLRSALPAFVGAFGVGLVLLGAREDVPQVLRQRVDLRGADETLQQDPTLIPPGRDLGVRGQPRIHSSALRTIRAKAMARERARSRAPSTGAESASVVTRLGSDSSETPDGIRD